MSEENKEISEELIGQARGCSSAEEIRNLAHENGYEITEEQAQNYYDRLNPKNGEVADEELDNVVGGCGGTKYDTKYDGFPCPYCGCTNKWIYFGTQALQAGVTDWFRLNCDSCGQIWTINKYTGAIIGGGGAVMDEKYRS